MLSPCHTVSWRQSDVLHIAIDAGQVGKVQEGASWLSLAPVGVEVHVTHGLLHAQAPLVELLAVRVDHVYKLGVARIQSHFRRHSLEQRFSWIQT